MSRFNYIKVSMLILLTLLMITNLFAGCASVDRADDDKKAATSDSMKDKKTDEAEKKPDKIRVFMGNAGMAIPEGVDLTDNYFINKLQEMANVEFTEITIPAYTDCKTKFNLMISSNDVPDFVHCWFASDVKLHGTSGAFLDLTDIIKNSEPLSGQYTKEMLEVMKADDGRIYGLQKVLGEGSDVDTLAVRKDLIDELNNGKMPQTPDEWYQVFKKEKEKYPDSVPYSTFAEGLWTIHPFFKAFGVSVYGPAYWQYTDGNFINAFEAPLCRDAILFHRKLYEENLLDRTFVTNKAQDYENKKFNKKIIVFATNMDSVEQFIVECADNNVKGAIVVPGIQPKVDDPRVKDEDVYNPFNALGSHVISIGSQTKNKDAVVRLIETLFKDEYKELIAFGRKGIEYTITDGKRELDMDKFNETRYRRIFAFIPKDEPQYQVDTLRIKIDLYIDKSMREKCYTAFKEGKETVHAKAAGVPSITPANLIKLSPDTLSKLTESIELSQSIILKAITGEISMEEYDKQVADFLKKYQFITDEYNEKLKKVRSRISG